MSIYPGVREGDVVVDGITVPYFDSGSAGSSETPIVLVHGSGNTAKSSFWALFPMLAFSHRVVAMDLINPPGGVELTVEHFLAQLETVIREVGHGKPVHLAGHSLGAVFTAALASRRPELVSSLVLIAGWIKTDRQQLLRNDLWARIRNVDPEALAELMVFSSYGAPYIVSRTAGDYEELLTRARNASDRSRQMEMNRTIDITEDMDGITAPTLVIGCSLDQMVPVAHSRQLFGAIEGARYVEVPSGHLVTIERPAELMMLIDRFVKDPVADPPGTIVERTHA